MKKVILFIIVSLLILPAQAEINFNNDYKMSIDLKGGFSTFSSWEIELGASYRPIRYVGANVALLMTSSMNNNSVLRDTVDIGTNNTLWKVKKLKDPCYQFAAKAGLQFTTPAVMLAKNEMGLSLRVSPGVLIPITPNNNVNIDYFTRDPELKTVKLDHTEQIKNSGAKFCYWYTRAELVIEYEDQWEFSLGYNFSNFDLYGGARNIKVGDVPIVIGEKKNMHTFTLGLSLKF